MPRSGEKCLAQSKLFFQSLAEPRPRVLPVPVGDRAGKPERLARLWDGEPPEKVQLSDPRRGSVFLPKKGKQLVDRQDEIGIQSEETDLIEQLEPHPPAGPLQPLAVPGMVDQNAPHRFRGGGEKVPSTVELLVADEPHVGLVHQRGGAEGVPRLLRGHSRGRELRNSS